MKPIYRSLIGRLNALAKGRELGGCASDSKLILLSVEFIERHARLLKHDSAGEVLADDIAKIAKRFGLEGMGTP